jgi:hypothetical protein
MEKSMREQSLPEGISNLFSNEVRSLLKKYSIIESNKFNDEDEHKMSPGDTIYGKALQELDEVKHAMIFIKKEMELSE